MGIDRKFQKMNSRRIQGRMKITVNKIPKTAVNNQILIKNSSLDIQNPKQKIITSDAIILMIPKMNMHNTKSEKTRVKKIVNMNSPNRMLKF